MIRIDLVHLRHVVPDLVHHLLLLLSTLFYVLHSLVLGHKVPECLLGLVLGREPVPGELALVIGCELVGDYFLNKAVVTVSSPIW